MASERSPRRTPDARAPGAATGDAESLIRIHGDAWGGDYPTGAILTLWTIGYERLLPDALVAELLAAGVQRLIDVRIRPQSRRPGMSKTKLGQRLGSHGVAYEHWRELGTPVEIRALFRRGALAQAREAYRRHLDAEGGEALERLLGEIHRGPASALLCLEAEPAHCHRRVICEALLERDPSLRVVDL
jgi:uncharacterized protein (DUF488 family)